jgi:tetratricopeptide (TPR) repeat protein
MEDAMLKSVVAVLLFTSLWSIIANAAGGDSGGSSSGSSSSDAIIVNPTPVVPSSPEPIPELVPEPAPQKAVAAPAATNIWKKKWGDLGPNYAAAVKLVKAEKFVEAISALKALQKPKDPRVLNYLGFSYRKLGKVDKALPHYFLALNIAPEYIPAHEYLGEAYVQINDLEKARAELRVIEKLCGKTCEEYQDLAESIKKASGAG